MMARDAASAAQAPIRVFDVPGAAHRRAQAIEVNGLGPVELPDRFFDENNEFRFSKDRQSSDVSENFLALAFAQGCRRNWPLARFYVKQALQSAALMQRSHVRTEARLLQAQLLRVGGTTRADDPEDEDKSARLATALTSLVSRSGRRIGDARAEAEWWALQLERLADVRTGGSSPGPELASGVSAIGRVLDADDHPLATRVRLTELLLAYVLLGLKRWKGSKGVGKPDYPMLSEAVSIRHAQLVADMEQLRLGHEVDELPQFSRAMEIIGYDLPRRLASCANLTPLPEPVVPAALLFDVVTLQSKLTLHKDEVSKVVAAELVRLIDQTCGRRSFLIVYAPVADRGELAELLKTLPDESLRAAALRANDLVYEVGNSQLFLEGHPAELEKILEGIRLIERTLSMPMMPNELRYHLEVERAYLHLLGALTEKEDGQRLALESVAEKYQALIQRYPDSAVLQFRLSVVMGDLGRDEEEFNAISEAMRLMAADSAINADHWFRSVVRRRLSLLFSSKATEMRDRIKGEADAEGREQYLKLMQEAYKLVSEGGCTHGRAPPTSIGSRPGAGSITRCTPRRSTSAVVGASRHCRASIEKGFWN